MGFLNKTFLLGNLTRDPELKFVPSGTAVCNLGLAVNRKWKGNDGQIKEEVLFIDVMAWGKSGEAAGEHLHKGSQLLVEGHLRLETWEAADGQKRSKIRLVAERLQFLGGKKDNKSAPDEAEGEPEAPGGDESTPF